MSSSFTELAQALDANPELRQQVMSAGSAAERSEILRSAGLPVPSHEDVNAAHAKMMEVVGGDYTPVSIISSIVKTAANAADNPASAVAGAAACGG